MEQKQVMKTKVKQDKWVRKLEEINQAYYRQINALANDYLASLRGVGVSVN